MITELQSKLEKFAVDRDWNQFHSPKNLIMALTSEVGELNDLFQWLTDEQSKVENLSPALLNRSKEEIADVFLYIIRIADKLNIDLYKASIDKISLNETKYPIELSKGNAMKYNRRNE